MKALMIAVAVVLLISLSISNVSAIGNSSLLKVESYNISVDADGDYTVVGEVFNPTNTTIYRLSISGKLYDNNNTFVAIDTRRACIPYIGPNQTAPFELRYWRVKGTAETCEFSLKWNMHEAKDLEIVDSIIKGNEVRGIIKNNGNETVDSITVIGAGYNKWGEVEDYDVDTYFSDALPLEPGETTGFFLRFDEHYFDLTSYGVQVSGLAWDRENELTNLSSYIQPKPGGRLTLLSKRATYDYDISSSGWSSWTAHAKGEVKNIGNEDIFCAKVVATLYYEDDYGSLSFVREEYVPIICLAPGQKSAFYIYSILGGTPTDYEVNELKWNKRKAEGLVVRDSHIESSPKGGYLVMTNVSNNGDKYVENVKVVVTAYNADGVVVSVGETADISFFKSEVKTVATRVPRVHTADFIYKVQVEGETWESSLRD